MKDRVILINKQLQICFMLAMTSYEMEKSAYFKLSRNNLYLAHSVCIVLILQYKRFYKGK